MDDEIRSRLTRLEESEGFLERTVEELNQQVIDCYARLERIAGRISSLERTVREMRDEPPDPEPDQTPP